MHKHLILHWASQSIKVIWERNPDSVLLKFCFMKTRSSFCSRAAAEIAAAIAVLGVRFLSWKLPQRWCQQRSKTSHNLPQTPWALSTPPPCSKARELMNPQLLCLLFHSNQPQVCRERVTWTAKGHLQKLNWEQGAEDSEEVFAPMHARSWAAG